MLSVDIARFVIFALYGVGVGFMLMTNCIAFLVLRPPQRLGFLWWHVTSISISFICLGLVSVERVTSQVGRPPTWRLPVTFVGTLLFAVAQVIIFNVERQRLVEKQGMNVARAMCPGLDLGTLDERD